MEGMQGEGDVAVLFLGFYVESIPLLRAAALSCGALYGNLLASCRPPANLKREP